MTKRESKRDRWRDILADPCNASAMSRNMRAIRDALEGLNDPDEAGDDSDNAIVFFEITESNVGGASTSAQQILYNSASDEWEPTGGIYEVFDQSGTGTYSCNFTKGHRGAGVFCQDTNAELGTTNALEILVLEGVSRFVEFVLTTAMEDQQADGAPRESWGAYPNPRELLESKIIDPLDISTDAVPGDVLLGVWDEKRQVYVNFGPPKGSAMGDMEFVAVCDDTFNSECVISGKINRVLSSTPSFCPPLRLMCEEFVWLTCMNYAPQADDPWPLQKTWCNWGKLVKKDFDVSGDVRDVYGVDCGDCGCFCFNEGEVVMARFQTDQCSSLDGLEFELRCISRDPINTGTVPGPDQVYFWGEFTYQGVYPKLGLSFPLESGQEINHGGNLVDSVIIVPGCGNNDDPCGILEVFYEWNGDFFPVSGNIHLDPGGSIGAEWIPVLNAQGCIDYCDRSYRYGVRILCTGVRDIDNILVNGSPGPAVIYHLLQGSAASAGVIDPCDDVLVPTPGDEIEDPGTAGSVSNCCFKTYDMNVGLTFGNTYTCNLTLPSDQNSVSFSINPMLWHVLGCREFYKRAHGETALKDSVLYKTVDCETTTILAGNTKLFLSWNGKVVTCEEE